LATYILIAWGIALCLFVAKWRAARGRIRGELNYLGAGIVIPGAGVIVTNLIHPLLTKDSTYCWLGPYFTLTFVAIVGHALIRRRVTDLRLVLHRGVTVSIAAGLCSIPVVLLVLLVWPRLFGHLDARELTLVFLSVVAISLALPVCGTASTRILDRYVYRSQADYQRTVREASAMLTRVLDLERLLTFIASTVARSIEAEGAAVYLRHEDGFRRAIAQRYDPSHFDAPELAPPHVVRAMEWTKEPLVIDDIRSATTAAQRELGVHLTMPNWSLVLPVVSDDGLTALIAVGPKLSGDAFYQHDLDLLMTLANQASIAIKNARLYAEVLLAHEYIGNIVATIESGVIAVTAGGQVSMFNRAAERLTGKTADHIIGRSVESLEASLSEPLLASLADGRPRTSLEVELGGANALRPVMCTTSPLRDPDGGVLGAVAVFNDLSALKELEVERRRAERLAYFEALTSGIAHEIKNPLVAIKTFTQLVPRRRDDANFIEEFTRIVSREIERMERLLERLSALSRPGRRPQIPVDLRVPISDALELMQPALEEKQINIHITAEDSSYVVLGHHAELEQLFLNLMMNAHEATPPGGAIDIRITQDAERITVTLIDTGPGIAPDLTEQVFEPFFSTKHRGSGLGLAICTGIAQAHGARLRAGNRPGAGAAFSVEFPLASMAAKVDA
jgi:PAS domain S-box-containing protein